MHLNGVRISRWGVSQNGELKRCFPGYLTVRRSIGAIATKTSGFSARKAFLKNVQESRTTWRKFWDRLKSPNSREFGIELSRRGSTRGYSWLWLDKKDFRSLYPSLSEVHTEPTVAVFRLEADRRSR